MGALADSEARTGSRVQASPGPEPVGCSRRAFLRWTLGAGLVAVAAGAGAAGYSLGVELRWLAVEQVTVLLPELPAALDGLRVAHLSDLH